MDMRIEGFLIIVAGVFLFLLFWRFVHTALGLVIGGPVAFLEYMMLHDAWVMSRDEL